MSTQTTTTHGIRLYKYNIPPYIQLEDYVGDRAGDYDLVGAAGEYSDALDALARRGGWTWRGWCYNTLSVPRRVTQADVLAAIEEIDVDAILQRHDRTAARA